MFHGVDLTYSCEQQGRGADMQFVWQHSPAAGATRLLSAHDDVATATALLTSLHHLTSQSTCIGYVRNLTPVQMQHVSADCQLLTSAALVEGRQSRIHFLTVENMPARRMQVHVLCYPGAARTAVWATRSEACTVMGEQPGWPGMELFIEKKSVLITNRALVARHATTLTRAPLHALRPGHSACTDAAPLRSK